MSNGEIRMVDRSRSTGGIVLVLFGGVFTAFSLLFLGVAGLFSRDDTMHVGVLFAIIPGVFLVVGLGIVVTGLRKLWLRYLFGTPTLIVPGQDLLLGDVLATRFERNGGSRRARRGRRTLSAELVAQEVVQYRRGTDTETVRHEIRRVALPVTMDDHPDAVAGRITVTIPVDWPPSIDLRHNKLRTTVEVAVSSPDLPSDTSSFILLVRPAVRAGALR